MEKRNFRKIDIYTVNLKGFAVYECSTTWSRTCKDAKARFLELHNYLSPEQIKTRFA